MRFNEFYGLSRGVIDLSSDGRICGRSVKRIIDFSYVRLLIPYDDIV